jgi:hypothetical protein
LQTYAELSTIFPRNSDQRNQALLRYTDKTNTDFAVPAQSISYDYLSKNGRRGSKAEALFHNN